MSPAPRASHFGLTRTPFGKSIPARDRFGSAAHAEAIARISFCVHQQLRAEPGHLLSGSGRSWANSSSMW